MIPVTVVSTMLVLAGIVFALAWLDTGLRVRPGFVPTLFFVLPFALGIVTVRYVFQPVAPVVLLAINYAIILLVILIPPALNLDEPTGSTRYTPVLPEAPFTVWRSDQVWYVLDRSGLEFYDVIVADRTVRQGEDRARLSFDDRRTVTPGERLVTFELATGGITGSSRGARALDALGEDLEETRNRLELALDRSVAQPFGLSESVRVWLPPILARRWYAVLLVGLWSLALVLVWTPARASRWPLLNMALVFVYLRLFVALPRLTDRLIEVDAIASRMGPRLRALSLPVTLLAIALILVIIAILLPRIDRRRTAT